MALVVGGNDANAVLFLEMEGDVGASTFANQAAMGHRVQVVSLFGARLSDEQAKFGSTSLFCDGGGARLETSKSNAFRFGTGDWTVDFWALLPVGNAANVFAWYQDDDNFLGLELVSASGNFLTMQFRYRRGGVDVFVVPFSTIILLASSFRHISVERSGATVRVYFSGAVKGTTTIAATETVNLNSMKLHIGNATRPGMAGLQRGELFIDSFRVSNVARWSGAFSPHDNSYTARQTLSGRGGYSLRAGQSSTHRGTQSVGIRNYPLHGRGVSDVVGAVSVVCRGAHGVLASHSLQGRGTHWLARRAYSLLVRGTQSVLEAGRSLAARGTQSVHSGSYALTARGTTTTRAARIVSARGSFGVPTAYSWKSRGAYAVVDDTLGRVLVYVRVGSPPDPAVDIPSEHFGFPVLNLALDLIPGLHYILVRRRNKYGMESENLQTIVVELDATFHPVNVRPRPPIKAAAEPIAGGRVRVTAQYLYGRDGNLQADNWNVYTRTDGTNPDPAIDTPAVVSIVKSDGIAKLSWDSAVFPVSTIVTALVRVARSVLDTRDDSNGTIVSAVAVVTVLDAPVVSSKLIMPLP